jgi:predicted component of viral defense system (DUF524 family)
LTNDTPENRFFKYAVTSVAQRHGNIVKQIVGMDNISSDAMVQMGEVSHELKALCNHPFFRTVGTYKGLSQESLILQRADGYAVMARIFAILNASYALKDGINTLETKDIATLYEIWCFIAVKNTVKNICGGDKSIAFQNRGELSRRFVYDLAIGQRSRVLFKDAESGTELAELFYNAKTSLDDSNGIEGAVAPTGVAQKPDIVLQLTKPVGDNKKFKLTYLFDAKYRIAERDKSGVDEPPDDAINQMHRYRDAIYYQSKEQKFLRKEIIGGYILFPGSGETTAVQQSRFYKSIEKVNIGAFPLRPDDDNKKLLEEFIRDLLSTETTGENELGKVIPHKGTMLQLADTDEAKTFLRDAPKKGVQEASMSAKVYPAPENSTSTPEHIRWILLSLSNRPVRLLKVMEYLGCFTGEEICGTYTAFEKIESPFTETKYHLWSVEEIKANHEEKTVSTD